MLVEADAAQEAMGARRAAGHRPGELPFALAGSARRSSVHGRMREVEMRQAIIWMISIIWILHICSQIRCRKFNAVSLHAERCDRFFGLHAANLLSGDGFVLFSGGNRESTANLKIRDRVYCDRGGALEWFKSTMAAEMPSRSNASSIGLK
jgi:hypothetical protein